MSQYTCSYAVHYKPNDRGIIDPQSEHYTSQHAEVARQANEQTISAFEPWRAALQYAQIYGIPSGEDGAWIVVRQQGIERHRISCRPGFRVTRYALEHPDDVKGLEEWT